MRTEKSCPQCGSAFADRPNKTYCSSACKLRAFRQKQEAEPQPVELLAQGALGRAATQRTATKRDDGEVRALKVQADLRKAELAHELEVEKLRLASQERTREREREAQRPVAPPPVQAPTQEARYQTAQAEAAERERQQRDAALDKQYEELVTEFLDLEVEELPVHAYANLLSDLKGHATDYRRHSGLRDFAPAPKRRLDFLMEMQDVLRETLREINDQPTPFFGQKTGGFELKKKWRAALRDTLLA